MSTSDPGFQLAITRWLADHRAEPSSVHIVEIAGHRCVIKLRRPKLTDVIVNATHYLRAGMLSLICWWTLGERPSVAVLMRTSLDDEASRLEFLTRHVVGLARIPLRVINRAIAQDLHRHRRDELLGRGRHHHLYGSALFYQRPA